MAQDQQTGCSRALSINDDGVAERTGFVDDTASGRVQASSLEDFESLESTRR